MSVPGMFVIQMQRVTTLLAHTTVCAIQGLKEMDRYAPVGHSTSNLPIISPRYCFSRWMLAGLLYTIIAHNNARKTHFDTWHIKNKISSERKILAHLQPTKNKQNINVIHNLHAQDMQNIQKMQ